MKFSIRIIFAIICGSVMAYLLKYYFLVGEDKVLPIVIMSVIYNTLSTFVEKLTESIDE